MQPYRRRLLQAAAASTLLVAGSRIAIKAQPGPRAIPIVARKFTYDPGEVTLKLNEPVIFQLTTLDVVMGFSVPDFATRATIVPGQMTELRLTPTKAGDFIFLCDVFCGSGHENMEGTLHVVG